MKDYYFESSEDSAFIIPSRMYEVEEWSLWMLF